MPRLSAPINGMYVRTIIIHPVVVHRRPPIEVQKQAVVRLVHYGCHSDENGVAPVHGFQFHANFEFVRRIGLEGSEGHNCAAGVGKVLGPVEGHALFGFWNKINSNFILIDFF